MILAERHPEAKLAPPPGGRCAPAWYQWLAFLDQFARAALPLLVLSVRTSAQPEHPPFVREALRQKIEDAWSLVDAHLAARGPYMLGAEFSGVDLLALTYMRWSRNMPRPVTDSGLALKTYADRCCAAGRAGHGMYDIEGLTEWLA
ncbi:MAG: hypothetical protein MZV49_13140 [Rhodopseudomonas palustris]|nr:hypothetical protein [Rhodopseudomonas palustris]